MANFTSSSSSLSDDPIISAAADTGGCSSSEAAIDEAFEDACSICLEPFTTQDPSTVTSCKHEYHLQCILEWSQRSKECPICWQLLVLKDPACQELLAAVEIERCLRSRNTSSAASSNLPLLVDFDVEQDSFSDDSDFDEHIMQHFAAAASRAHYLRRRERQRSSGQGPSQFLVFTSPTNLPTAQQTNLLQTNAKIVLFRQPPTDAPRAPSEVSSFSESIKSKWVAASARYKESISKSTRGIKEKLLARNNSVKELSKGVQKEMHAGIAGVARMIERLDLTSKRTGASSPVSDLRPGASDFSLKGKAMQENIIAQALEKRSEEIALATSLDVSSHVSCTVPSRLDVLHVQVQKP
ncbi:hypothetical protein GH714_019554 [Hevea brasiliensis]|uniref:RING-type E3 ubiquitin transferase n=1 Tax=Hevea brasiliensis TaxID=3981 RepID=A0A6A6K628_HEVBR|nr:hypothetical protein GH714_019554 [Hevea brasiliensis]